LPVSNIASVASFFVSRIDTLIDENDEMLKVQPRTNRKKTLLTSLQGKSRHRQRQAYLIASIQEIYGAAGWKALLAKGRAATQRSVVGPAPAQKQSVSRTSSTWKNSSAPKPWTRFLQPPSMLREHGKLAQTALPKMSTPRKKPWTISPIAGISMKEVTEKTCAVMA